MYTRVVFVSRLSAIGDVIVAAHAVHLLTLNGYYPVFITSKLTQQIPQCMPYLNSFICYEKGAETRFYIQNSEVKKEEYINFINSMPVEKKPLFLDLQKTSRSKRALKEMRRYFKFEKIYTVSKKTLYRVFLIFVSFLLFSQRKKKSDLITSNLQTVKDLQEDIVKKITQRDKKKFIAMASPKHVIGRSCASSTEGAENLGDYICLFPGASGFIKMWPKENFRALMHLILQSTKFNIVLCGSQSEIGIGEFLNFPVNVRVINMIHKTNLQQTLHLISNAKYIVTNDSFAAHAAEAFGIPSSVLFGATSPKFGFAPRAANIKIEYLNLACSPCTRHGKTQCHFKNIKCLKEITAQMVFDNMMENHLFNS